MIHMRKVLFLDFDGVMVTDSRQQLMLPAPERILQLADHRKSLLILGD